MLHPDDHVYYSARMAEEFKRGDEARHRLAAPIHYELAFRYWLLAVESAPIVPQVTPVEGARIDSPPHQVIHAILEPA